MWIHLTEQELVMVEDALAHRIKTLHAEDAKAAFGQLAKDLHRQNEEFDHDDPYRAAAKSGANDEFEVDDDAVVSAGGDPGAWVMCWTWITDEEAGLDRGRRRRGRRCLNYDHLRGAILGHLQDRGRDRGGGYPQVAGPRPAGCVHLRPRRDARAQDRRREILSGRPCN